MNYRITWFFIPLLTNFVRSEDSIERDNVSDDVFEVFCNTSDTVDRSKSLNDGEFDFYHEYKRDIDYENITHTLFTGCTVSYIPQAFIRKMPHVQVVVLSNSGVQTIKREDFKYISQLKVLWMSQNRLTELPEYLFSYTPQIVEIDFSSNQISRIHPNAFVNGTEHLETIDLSQNRIKMLNVNSFMNLTVLTRINLNYNLLDFHPNLFQSVKLEKIDLKGNKLTYINCSLFPAVSDGDVIIDVSNNQLQSIDLNCGLIRSIFKRNAWKSIFSLDLNNNQITNLLLPNSRLANNLKRLSIAKNKIEKISIESGLFGLISLDASDNNLSNILDILRRCFSLTTLNLSSNKVRQLRVNSFVKMPQLERLNLSNNNLIKVDYGTFSHSKNLLYLDISHNQLKNIDFDLFPQKFGLLTHLHLNDNNLNQITGLNEMIFPQLKELNILNNHFNCTYLAKFIQTINISRIDLTSNPSTEEGDNIYGIWCEDEQNILKERFTMNGIKTHYQHDVNILPIVKDCLIVFVCVSCLVLISVGFGVTVKANRSISVKKGIHCSAVYRREHDVELKTKNTYNQKSLNDLDKY